MKDFLISVTGLLNMLIFSIVSLPQVYKTIKTKNVDGVSIFPFFLLVFANIDASIYALLIEQKTLFIKYFIGFLISLFYITIYYKYEKKK